MDIDTLKSLADENRLRIVMLLADGERCICDLASALDESDALISHHVKQLREAGLVRTRRVGRWLHCSLEPDTFHQLAVQFEQLSTRAADAATRQGQGCCAPGEYPDQKEEIWP